MNTEPLPVRIDRDISIPAIERVRISFVVPVYNVEEYIRECVLSILALEGISFEIILVDDGSPDKSMKRVADLVSQNPNIKTITQENQGLSGARNKGLGFAKGDYVFFVDSDDKIDAVALQHLFSKIGETEDIIIGDFYKWDGTNLLKEPSLVDHPMRTTGNLLLQRFFLRGFEMAIGRNIYKTSFLKRHRFSFIEGIYYEDVDWTVRCLTMAEEVLYVNQAVYLYRHQRVGSIINSPFSVKKYHDLFRVSHTINTFASNIKDKKTAGVISRAASNLLLTALKHAEMTGLNVDHQPTLTLYKKLKLPLCNNKIMQYILLVSRSLFFTILKRRSF